MLVIKKFHFVNFFHFNIMFCLDCNNNLVLILNL